MSQLSAEPLFLQLDSQVVSHTKKEGDVQDTLDELTNDAFDVLSFTENAAGIGESEGKKKIKTQGTIVSAQKRQKNGKLTKENMMNEEQAIAAFSEQKLDDASESLAQGQAEAQEQATKQAEDPEETDPEEAQAEKEQQEQEQKAKKEKEEADRKQKEQEEKQRKEQERQEQIRMQKQKEEDEKLPEATVDISSIRPETTVQQSSSSDDENQNQEEESIGTNTQSQQDTNQDQSSSGDQQTQSMTQKPDDSSSASSPRNQPDKAKNLKVVVKVSDKSNDKNNEDEMVETGQQNAESLDLEGQAAVAAAEQAEVAQHNLYTKKTTHQKKKADSEDETSNLSQQDIQDAQAVMTGDLSLEEVISKKESLKEEYKKVKKQEIIKQKKDEQIQKEQQVDDTVWGQMGSMVELQRNTISKAQGYEEPQIADVQLEPPPPPPPPRPREEVEKEEAEKMRLFSDFVAADAETSQPVVKKEPKKERPLHFKYFHNDGEDENSLTEELTDDILGKESNNINKKKPKMMYDHSDPDWNVTPMEQVDYSHAKKDKTLLYEPVQTIDIEDVPEVLKQREQQAEEEKQKQEAEIIELTVK